MVDMVLLQQVSYIAGAFGVCVAAVYYVSNLRMNQRIMRINMTNSLVQRLCTEDFLNKYTELMYMNWRDYDDFEKKYGSDTKPDNFVKRMIIWNILDSLGTLLKRGMADEDVLFSSQIVGTSLFLWHKFRDVFEMNRRLYSGANAWLGLEYLANEVDRRNKIRDASYIAEMGDPSYEKAKIRVSAR